MSLATVRAAIKTILDAAQVPVLPSGTAALSTVARTHDYFREITTDQERDARLVMNGVLHAWMISMAEDSPFLTTNSLGSEGRDVSRETGRYKFSLYGYYGVQDSAASEKRFPDIVEAVIAAFRANKKLGLAGPGSNFIDSGPMQWRLGGWVMFPPQQGGVLCHRAVLELVAREQTEP